MMTRMSMLMGEYFKRNFYHCETVVILLILLTNF